MFLFFDWLSRPARLIALRDGQIVAFDEAPIAGKEFDTLIPFIDTFLVKNELQWSDIRGVSVVVGPIAFSSGRIITLTWNTLARVHGFPLHALDFWEYGDLCSAWFPRILVANRAEALVQSFQWGPCIFTPLAELSGEYLGAALLDFTSEQISIQSYTIDARFAEKYHFTANVRLLEPLYVKPPNITLPTHASS